MNQKTLTFVLLIIICVVLSACTRDNPTDDSNSDITIDLATSCGSEWDKFARRVVYAWDKSWRGRDPAPDGDEKYAGKLLLDDNQPDLETEENDTWALAVYKHDREADTYFRQLAGEGFSSWDGCYGSEATEPIMTSRVHYPHVTDCRACWQNNTYSEVLYHDDYITRAVVVHERTHGLVDRIVRPKMLDVGGPDGQTGALYESIADVFAVLMTGSSDIRSIQGVERSLEDPTCYGQVDHQNDYVRSVDEYTRYVEGIEWGKKEPSCYQKVHDWLEKVEQKPDRIKYVNAGIPSTAAYLMIEDIGKEKAERIFFHALSFIQRKNKSEQGDYSFDEFATRVEQACRYIAANPKKFTPESDINESNCDQVRKAFQDVGILPSEKPLTASRNGAFPPNGRWEGSVSQVGASSYTLVMTLDGCEQQMECGQFQYPELSCGGTLTFLRTDGNAYTFREKMTSGLDRCADNGSITLQPNGDGNWNWHWYHNQYGEANAVLKKMD